MLSDAVRWAGRRDVRWHENMQYDGSRVLTSSWYANWTNDPCLYRRDFLIRSIQRSLRPWEDLERNDSPWWPRQGYLAAQREGALCCPEKYSPLFSERVERKLKRLLRRLGANVKK
jgi:hypothetical protein